MEKPQVTIYTDGGADPNPGAGGWGAVLIFGDYTKELSGSEDHTTNNRMELTAALRALEALKQACQVEMYTDSQYLKNGITQWMPKWISKGWRDSKGETVQNVDLWQALNVAIQTHQINWNWVRGHTGDHYNERADQLATAARPQKTQTLAQDRSLLFLKTLSPRTGNMGACGWAACLQEGHNSAYFQGNHSKSNSYYMGLLALQTLFEQIDSQKPLQIITEEELIFKGFTQWIDGWRAKGWVKPDKYNDLWQTLDKLSQGRDLLWYFVRKNDDSLRLQLSDLADRAKTARDKLK